MRKSTSRPTGLWSRWKMCHRSTWRDSQTEQNPELPDGKPAIDFANTFPLAKELRSKLRANVHGYRAVRVSLQLPGGIEEYVEKYRVANGRPWEKLLTPEVGTIRDPRSRAVAYFWAAFNSLRGNIDKNAEDNAKYAGFVYEMKGCSIGDRERLRALLLRTPIYPWFTGEVYVLDPLVENAERNDFETSPAMLSTRQLAWV